MPDIKSDQANTSPAAKTLSQTLPPSPKPSSEPKPTPQTPPDQSSQKKPRPPFNELIKRGFSQFTAIPKTQKFTPPPPPVAPAPTLPTQPSPQGVPQPKKEKNLTPMKFSLLIALLFIIGAITVGATLVATDYTIWDPPQIIKNILETILSAGKN